MSEQKEKDNNEQLKSLLAQFSVGNESASNSQMANFSQLFSSSKEDGDRSRKQIK